MNKPYLLTVISVPFDLGAGLRGASLGPDAILQAGLARRLQQIGHAVEAADFVRLPLPPTRGRKPTPPAAPATAQPLLPGQASTQPDTNANALVPPASRLKHLDEVAAINRELAHQVAASAAGGRFPLVLGGDHSLAIGTISGLAQVHRRLGVLWFDAHSDLNTAETSPSGNIHGMSLSALLGKGHERLTQLGGAAPKVRPEHVVLIGLRDLDPGEKALIAAEGIRCFTMHDIDMLGMAKVMEEAIRIVSRDTDGVHVSFDIDSVDPVEAPGTGTPVRGGLSYREAHLALELLAEARIVTSAEFVEVNPTLESDGRTAKLAVDLISSLLGETIL
ncbi:arginase [Paenibacillus allorhizosphaerae]|uniref:Arginase n=1 Tax=Paenibacillus allorhizosphaerae TaxID=2849866 RepID=A0ABN7TGX9_9BACL|nr:arginase [Paenibacillus allorhizosphaerae]CAG7622037.1 Arginase [Paenibacillus allorhizosphaerae]